MLTTGWQMEATAGSLFASPVHAVRVLASKLASQPKESRQIAGPRHERIDAGMMPRLLTTQQTPDINLSAFPLDRIDVSDPRLYQHDCWYPLFERLRKESPAHYCAESAYGPYCSLSRYTDIVECEMDTLTVSSVSNRVHVEDKPPDKRFLNLLGMDSAHIRFSFGVSTRCQSGFLGNPNDRGWLAAPGYDATRPSSPKAIEEVSIRYWSNGIDASISRRRGK
jgi:hypothetical protein